MANGSNGKQAAPKTKCPICRKPTVYETRPFCSKRCRDVDLSRWFGGAYTASRPVMDEDDLFSTDKPI